MFDEHLTRQHRLNYFVRGPEWAFALPQGDLAALEDIMRRCSGFWNGVGSLLVPVWADGRLPRWLDSYLGLRGIDQCFMHEALGERASASVRERFPCATPMWDRFDEHEIHPLHLLGPRSPEEPKPPMEIPQFGSGALRRMTIAAWGHLSDEDLPHWRDRCEVVAVDGEAAYGALLRGQVRGLSASPLQLAARGMNLIEQRGPFTWHPFIWVFDSASFNDLTHFWNFRARLLSHSHTPPIVGIPQRALQHSRQLGALTDWTPRISGLRRVPDTFVVCRERLDNAVRAALADVPFVEETETRYREMSGRDIEPNDPRTFAFMRPLLGGRFVRGTRAGALVSFNDGKAALALSAPEEFPVRNLAHTRLVFGNLPLPLPVTASTARAINVNAVPADGVMVVTAATAEWNFDVRLPTAAEALRNWAGDNGFTIKYTQDGRDAEAVLRRLTVLRSCWG